MKNGQRKGYYLNSEKFTTNAQIVKIGEYFADCIRENGELFHFHENPNPECPIGRNIHAELDDKLERIQRKLEEELASITMEDVKNDIQKYI